MAQNRRQATRLSSSPSFSGPLSKPPKTVYSEEVELRLINDYIFKYVFGREETKDILLDLVNAILEDSGWPRVRSLTLGACRTYPRATRFSAMLDVFRHKNGSSVGPYR